MEISSTISAIAGTAKTHWTITNSQVKSFKSLKVIELATVMAGPSVGQFFAEMGAEVIKIENPHCGDVTRGWTLKGEQPSEGRSTYFSSINFGKKLELIDLKSPQGQKQIHQWLSRADILLTNFKPGDAHKLELAPNFIRKKYPRLIYGHITGFGESDPRLAYDVLLQAECGFSAMNGPDTKTPCRMPVAMIDNQAAHQMKQGLLSGLLERQETGQGCYIHVSLYNAALSALMNQASNYLNQNYLPQPMGHEHPNIFPYGSIFECHDNIPLVLVIGSDSQFRAFSEILGENSWWQDPRFSTNAARVENREDLRQLIQSKVAQKTYRELLKQCHQRKVPVAELKNLSQVLSEPKAQEMILAADGLKTVKQVAFEINGALPNNSHLPPPPFPIVDS